MTRPIVSVSRTHLFTVVLLLFLFAASATFAQVQTGTITGVVTDEQGAVMPGVTVMAESDALIVAQTVTTNANGIYTVINLQPGEYTLTFETQGFATVTRAGVVVNVARVTSVNQSLRLSAVAETITVTAESPAVDTKSVTKGTNFDNALLENIPQAREIWSTVEQVPGATMSKFNVGGAESAQQSSMMIHGSAVGQQEYAIEGLKLNWPGGNGGATAFYFDHDSYAEINIMTNGAPAEVGTSGVYMNMVTKSGGNDLSGGTSIFWEDDSFQSNNVSDALREQGVTSGNPINYLWDFNVHLGGPIVEDKIWFFSSYRRYDINRQILGVFRDDGSPAPDVNHQTNAIGKVTAQLDERNKVMANFNFNYQNRFYRRAGANFVEEVASRRQIEPAYIIQGQWTSLLTDELFLDVRYGYLDLVFPLDYQEGVGPDDLPLLDIIQSTLKVAALERFQNDATRHQVNASATYFVDDWGGTHQFKAGFEFGRAFNGWERSANGNIVRRLFDGEPFEVQTYSYPLQSENVIRTYSLYFQDSWVPSQRLSINYGVRFEDLVGFAPAQGRPGNEFFPAEDFPKIDNIPNWTNAMWRFGATYDLTGDGRTALKGYVGRFMLQEGTRLVETLNPNARSGDFRSWNDANGDLIPQFEELGPSTRPFGGIFTRIDPDLKRPYSDEFNLGVERELGPNLNFGVTYYRRHNRRLISGINLAVSPGSYTEVTVEGPTGPIRAFNQDPDTLGDADLVVTNIDGLEHTYNGVEFAVTKRMADNWQLVGGYTVGAVEGLFDRGFGDDFNNPNLNINREGAKIDKDSTHVFKLIGTYIFPKEVTVSTNLKYFTGQPVQENITIRGLNQGTETILANPRGTTRLDNVTLWDFRISKVFNVGSTRMEAMFDVFNLLNQSSATAINTNVGPTFGRISEILPPRVARLGLQVRF
jgi:hypothetical protein